MHPCYLSRSRSCVQVYEMKWRKLCGLLCHGHRPPRLFFFARSRRAEGEGTHVQYTVTQHTRGRAHAAANAYDKVTCPYKQLVLLKPKRRDMYCTVHSRIFKGKLRRRSTLIDHLCFYRQAVTRRELLYNLLQKVRDIYRTYL